MPTGYTAGVCDGKVTDFRTFALQCARNFGACIMQRDDPGDEPPKLVEPSDFYAKNLAEAKAELARLQAMSVEQAGREADAEWTAHVQSQEEYRQRRRETRNRYEGMLRQVEKWNPPSPDHREMKVFMASQLRESIDFDCTDYEDTTKHLSGEAWLTARRGRAAENIGRYTVEAAKEVERTEGRNRWITQLYESLEAPDADA